MNFVLNKLLQTWQWLAIRLQNSEKSMMLSLILILFIIISYVQPFYPNYNVSASLFFVAAFLLFLAIIVINSYAVLTKHLLQSKQFFTFDNAYRNLAHDLMLNTRDGGYTHIQVISISGREEWDLIKQQFFREDRRLRFQGTLNIEFVLSDGHFLTNEDQDGAANETFNVVKEINAVKEQFAQPSSRLTIELYRIKHLPPIHGILISGKTLYIGDYDWTSSQRRPAPSTTSGHKNETIKVLTPKNTDFRKYMEKQNATAALAVENFVCWFKYFVRQADRPDDRPPVQEGQKPGPPPQEDQPPKTEHEAPFEQPDNDSGTEADVVE